MWRAARSARSPERVPAVARRHLVKLYKRVIIVRFSNAVVVGSGEMYRESKRERCLAPNHAEDTPLAPHHISGPVREPRQLHQRRSIFLRGLTFHLSTASLCRYLSRRHATVCPAAPRIFRRAKAACCTRGGRLLFPACERIRQNRTNR